MFIKLSVILAVLSFAAGQDKLLDWGKWEFWFLHTGIFARHNESLKCHVHPAPRKFYKLILQPQTNKILYNLYLQRLIGITFIDICYIICHMFGFDFHTATYKYSFLNIYLGGYVKGCQKILTHAFLVETSVIRVSEWIRY